MLQWTILCHTYSRNDIERLFKYKCIFKCSLSTQAFYFISVGKWISSQLSVMEGSGWLTPGYYTSYLGFIAFLIATTSLTMWLEQSGMIACIKKTNRQGPHNEEWP